MTIVQNLIVEMSLKNDESLREVYEKMYTEWLKVCDSNHALNGEIKVLRNLNAKAKGNISELELLFVEKSENLKSVSTKLEITQKSLRLLNNGSSKLDHSITTCKSSVIMVALGIKVSLLVLRLFSLILVCLMIQLMFR